MIAFRFASHAILLVLAGCSTRSPIATVDLIDTSRSITPRAERAAFDAVRAQITHMQRGDELVLIPITGEAANDAGGRMLRLSIPMQRETYDADQRRFQEQARKQLAGWMASLDPNQVRTDILGALDAARQELALLPKSSTRRLIVASDFLEDDGTYRFASDAVMATPWRARQLAAQLREQRGFSLGDIALCLGRLESSDFAPLPAERKEAVGDFWRVYFGEKGSTPEMHVDGTGILADAERGCSVGRR